MTNLKLENLKEQIISEYKSGLSGTALGKKYGVWPTTITSYLKKWNVPRRQNGDFRKYVCNFNFFELILTEAVAYWLGFIAADGYISNLSTQHVLRISLSSLDRDHLQKFLNDIDGNYPIHDRTLSNKKKNKNYKDSHVSTISISNKKIVSDLVKYGLFQNKSLVLKFIENIPEHLLHHFCRGYVDGDGGFYCYEAYNNKNNKSYKYYSFENTSSWDFNNRFQEILIEKCNLNKTKHAVTGNACTMRYMGREQVGRIFNWLYKDATIFLERKRNKVYPHIFYVEPWHRNRAPNGNFAHYPK